MTFFALLALAAPPLAAPPSADPLIAERTLPHTCQSVGVWPSDRLERPANRPWSARRLPGLDIEMSLRAGVRARRVELHVLTPGGHLYQKLVAVTRPAEPPSRGRPGPLRVATAHLPVAGTQITQRGLYGRWSLVPYLEGDLEPCGQRVSFTLAP
jgi:hypothetical protein